MVDTFLVLGAMRGEDRGLFSDEQLDAVGGIADTLLAVIAKHRQIVTNHSFYNPASEKTYLK